MNVSAVAATVVVKPPEVPVFKAPDKTPDVQNGAAADGTRTPRPTQLAALPRPDRERGSTSWPDRLPCGTFNAASLPKKHTIMSRVNGTRA